MNTPALPTFNLDTIQFSPSTHSYHVGGFTIVADYDYKNKIDWDTFINKYDEKTKDIYYNHKKVLWDKHYDDRIRAIEFCKLRDELKNKCLMVDEE